MQFDRIDAPVAHSMIDHLDHPTDAPTSPFARFTCCWAAFNNIYFLVSKEKSDQEAAAGAKIRNKPPQEREQHEYVLAEFSAALKENLLASPAFHFFLTRFPRWGHNDVTVDDNGNRANGVTNLARSAYKPGPVLSTIDARTYQRWLTPARLPTDLDELAAQVLDVVYTVRNNTMHGGKELLDPVANDVLRQAYVLLRMIVDSFLVP